MSLILNAEIKEASKSRGGPEVEVAQVERCPFRSWSAHLVSPNISQKVLGSGNTIRLCVYGKSTKYCRILRLFAASPCS